MVEDDNNEGGERAGRMKQNRGYPRPTTVLESTPAGMGATAGPVEQRPRSGTK